MRGKSARRALAAVALCAAFVTVGANVAFAGEITGNGKSLKDENGELHGRSICSFSGRNDTFSGDPDVPDADGFTRTQNWGQIPHEQRQEFGFTPGQACNPNAAPPEE